MDTTSELLRELMKLLPGIVSLDFMRYCTDSPYNPVHEKKNKDGLDYPFVTTTTDNQLVRLKRFSHNCNFRSINVYWPSFTLPNIEHIVLDSATMHQRGATNENRSRWSHTTCSTLKILELHRFSFSSSPEQRLRDEPMFKALLKARPNLEILKVTYFNSPRWFHDNIRKYAPQVEKFIFKKLHIYEKDGKTHAEEVEDNEAGEGGRW